MVGCWEEADFLDVTHQFEASIIQLGRGLQCFLKRACQVAKRQAGALAVIKCITLESLYSAKA